MRKTFLSIILLSVACITFASSKREMRAAWIATVANIDWPGKDAVGNTELQKQEMIDILDSLQALHLNTIIFQIRPTADALYSSPYEPWSSWLTGRQGVPPTPYYDPLEFVIYEAHKRCLDVHVWLNPYRATSVFNISDIAPNHIYNQHPEWFIHYGDKYYFDPSLNETRDWLNKIVADIVTRYDVDAIHFDDYFYPYKVKGQDFPDNKSFKNNPRGFTDKDDWRRDNVNLVIQQLQTTIKSIKPWVEFGISPFGVWRNEAKDPVRGSKTTAGVQNYDDLYADILLWLEKGWIDYVMPQLYWEIGKKAADYEILLNWWAEYSYHKNLYIGVFASQLGKGRPESGWQKPNEICRQLRMLRKKPEVDGISFYSSIGGLLPNKLGTCDSLRSNLFSDYALVPQNRNIKPQGESLAPENVFYLTTPYPHLEWDKVGNARQYVVYAFDVNKPFYNTNDAHNILAITSDNKLDLSKYHLPEETVFFVTSVNRYKIESQLSQPAYTPDNMHLIISK